MHDQRPVNLALTTIHFPITAIVSITHRIAGVILFLALPFLLWALSASLYDRDSYQTLLLLLQAPCMKIVSWLILSATIYHSVMGIRHFIMDFGLGETLEGSKVLSWLSLLIAMILIALAGVWIW